MAKLKYKNFRVMPVSVDTIYEGGKVLDNPKHRCLYYFLYLTACRITESLFVRKQDIKKELVDNYSFLIMTLRTEKNPTQNFRTLPILIDKTPEGKMAEFIVNYIDNLKEDDLLFAGLDRKMAWYFLRKVHFTSIATKWELEDGKNKKTEIVNHHFVLHPHFLRRCRLSHLSASGMSAQNLKQYAGWSNIAPSDSYVMLNYKDLVNAIINMKRGQ